MLYLYGVVRGDHPAPKAGGIGSPPARVQVIGSNEVAVAASDIEGDTELKEPDAHAHLGVLIDLLSRGPVLPLRMGTVAPDEAAVRSELLDPATSELLARLEVLDGRVEVQLDVDDDESSALAELAGEFEPDARSAGDFAERLELGRQVGELLVDRRRRLGEQILEEFRELAVDDVPRAVLKGPEDPVLRWAFLIEAKDIGRFDDTVGRLRNRYPGVAIRHVGPLPAAHFVDRIQTTVTEPSDSFEQSGSWSW